MENRRAEPNFGRFYNQSYLGLEKPKRSASESKAKGSSSSHFHRPENFTYAKDPPSFLKKKASGKRVVKKRQGASPVNLRNQEAVRMSMFPSAKPKKPDEVDKIERDDWPAPASPAALLPEIYEDDEDEKPKEDPRIKRELEEISKIKDESGIGSVIYKELDRLKARPLAPLDPWKASRAPSAKFEPRYRTRYQSPMFACNFYFVLRCFQQCFCFKVLHRHDSSYTGYDGPTIPLLQLQKSTWHTEIEPSMYPYDRLKITNFDLPKDVDINQLEIHLSNQEFENLFNMSRDGFHRLPEWKRNDMKRKLHLY
ncbi:actin-binding LIM protein 1 [Elysia marginata]|uniref:Actin-binding LIM protein 1 n=1 Tax=Elysia marginata TaxID=1093978 RepID=A0AAV4H806_9GAST|nr:actin-binding LIM protein 1 [Elysia marginata]